MTRAKMIRSDETNVSHLRSELRYCLRRGLAAPRLVRRLIERALEELEEARAQSLWSLRAWRDGFRGLESQPGQYRRAIVRLLQKHRVTVSAG